MRRDSLLTFLAVGLITTGLVGCGQTAPTTLQSGGDPIQQEIVQEVQRQPNRAPTAKGGLVNSAGETVTEDDIGSRSSSQLP